MPNMKTLKSLDGFRVLDDEGLLLSEFDYIIVYSEQILEFAVRICEMRNRSRRCVLPGRIFDIAHFDFEKYIQLYESKISIMSNRCFGGLLYNHLGMEFCSPFINLCVEPPDFLHIMSDLESYMREDLVYVYNEWEMNLKREYPAVRIKDVMLWCNHYTSMQEVESYWYRRRERINYQNIFVMCDLHSDEEAEIFLNLPYEKKIAFADFRIEHPQIVDTSVLGQEYFKRYPDIGSLLNNQGKLSNETCMFDLFKLLNGEKDFMRIQM